jgi:hypothetical protein
MKHLTSLLPLPCLAFGLAATSAQAQLFSGGGGASASVTPGAVSSSSFGSNFPEAPLDGSQPGSTSGSATFTATGATAVGSATGNYSSSASWTGLSGSSSASSTYPATAPNSSFGDVLGYGAVGSTLSSATLTVSDLVFSGPSSAIPVSLNLLFSGTQNASGTSGSSYGIFNFTLDLSGAAQFSGSFSGRADVYSGGGINQEGLLTGYNGGANSLQSGIWAAPTGIPLTLTITLYTQAYASSGYGATADGDATAALALLNDSPLFNLPSGFSADSASLGLVGNVYSPVPEPSEYVAIAGLGLLAFGAWHRRTIRTVRH